MDLHAAPVNTSDYPRVNAYQPIDPSRIERRPALDIEIRYWNGDAIYIGDWILNPTKVRYRWHNAVVALSILDVKLGYFTISHPAPSADAHWTEHALAAQREPCNRPVVRRGGGPISWADRADEERLREEIQRKFAMRMAGCEFCAVLKTLAFNSPWSPTREEIHQSRAGLNN